MEEVKSETQYMIHTCTDHVHNNNYTFCHHHHHFRCESFWPVFSKDAQGVIIVYNPGNAKHEKEIEKW